MYFLLEITKKEFGADTDKTFTTCSTVFDSALHLN